MKYYLLLLLGLTLISQPKVSYAAEAHKALEYDLGCRKFTSVVDPEERSLPFLGKDASSFTISKKVSQTPDFVVGEKSRIKIMSEAEFSEFKIGDSQRIISSDAIRSFKDILSEVDTKGMIEEIGGTPPKIKINFDPILPEKKGSVAEGGAPLSAGTKTDRSCCEKTARSCCGWCTVS